MSIGEECNIVAIDHFGYYFFEVLINFFLVGVMIECTIELDFKVSVVIMYYSDCFVLFLWICTSGSTSTAFSEFFSMLTSGLILTKTLMELALVYFYMVLNL